MRFMSIIMYDGIQDVSENMGSIEKGLINKVEGLFNQTQKKKAMDKRKTHMRLSITE